MGSKANAKWALIAVESRKRRNKRLMERLKSEAIANQLAAEIQHVRSRLDQSHQRLWNFQS